MTSHERRDRLAELWKAYTGVGAPEAAEGREEILLSALRTARDVFESEDPIEVRLSALHYGRTLLALLVAETAGWAVDWPDVPVSTEPSAFAEKERSALLAVLRLADAIGTPLHRDAIDPVPVLMPRWLMSRLKDGIEALEFGEVQSLLQPAVSRRHGEAWSWDQARRRAVEHVHFLHGQDVGLERARSRVAAAARISAVTLRQWENELSRTSDFISAAQAAGRLAVRMECDPFGTEPLDALQLAALQAFRREPLSAFGKAYSDRFGHRHNQ